MDKVQARRHFRQVRQNLDHRGLEDGAAALGRHVLAWLAAATPAYRPGSGPSGSDPAPAPAVAAYLSVGQEPGTAPLLAALHHAGYDVVVPVCEPDHQLSWCRWSPTTVLRSRNAGRVPLIEPVGPRQHFSDIPSLRLVLVPALAVDTAGNRLGQGGGYYDRFLAHLRTAGSDAHIAGYVHSHELVPESTFPAGALDMPLDGVFTPAGYRALRPAFTGGHESD